ncbi:hypothetical protein [Natranaerofaba carboxydovora]|uniref:hypothetical protein n=1 Tax=Natranaerofaba carboxydovora TaxID=2742683 RepID=UPI001F135B0E|nr:hypothetical protein [Natranaerofaba carboxydovora]
MRFRTTDGTRVNYDDHGAVVFELHFDGDASVVDIDEDYGRVLDGEEGDEEWVIGAYPSNGDVEFNVVTNATGDVEVTAYRGPSDEGEIDEVEFTVTSRDDVERIELDLDPSSATNICDHLHRCGYK